VIVYGRNPVREALKGRRAASVGEVWASAAAAREPWLSGLKLRVVGRAEELSERCGSDSHQGVCAEVGSYPYVGVEELLRAGARSQSLLVALDQVQDPQNLGSICRTAECAGVAGVVIPERRAAEVTPAVCKASAGAVEHLRIARAGNLADFMRRAREHDFWCYGASAPDASEGKPTVSYDSPDYRGSGVLLVLGSEGRGLRPLIARECDELIALPMLGKVQSLNVSAAAAALLYEILQQRGGGLDMAS
jgi:23S rRNA (guanosine2251-2'-O)-methyltransferase